MPESYLSSLRRRWWVLLVVPVAGSRGSGRLYASGIVAGDHATVTSLAVATGAERIEIPTAPR